MPKFGSKTTLIVTVGIAMAVTPIACRPLVAQDQAAQEVNAADEDYDILLRGPLHEAVAEPVSFDPVPGVIVPKSPPDPIDELPPEVKPDSAAIWISGYWAWDDERDDFVYVSGTWRVPPEGRRWVPGYWTEAEGGYQWISGFWAAADQEELTYLPVPPESLEQGPTSTAPSNDYLWVNGCWIYRDGRYAWRAGYWAPGHDRWVWTPDHYVWTPRGCVFNRGYWDRRLDDRGMCFAPVYFHRPVYRHSGYYYSPSVAIDLPRIHLQLFVRPTYHHYYYGDWYGRDSARFGIYANFAFHQHRGYDPLFAYNHWHYKQRGIDFTDRVRGWHQYFEKHEDRRPPKTWRDREQFVSRNRDFDQLSSVVVGDRLSDLLQDRQRSRNFERIDRDRRIEQLNRNSAALRQLGQSRLEAEAEAKASVRADGRDGDEGVRRQTFRLPVTPDAEQARNRLQQLQRRAAEQRREAIESGRRPLDRPEARPEVRLPGNDSERHPSPPSFSPRRRPESNNDRDERPRPQVNRPDVEIRRPDVQTPKRTERPKVERPSPRQARPEPRRSPNRAQDVQRQQRQNISPRNSGNRGNRGRGGGGGGKKKG